MTFEWNKADLHIHTTHSDGTASVREVLAHVAAHTDLQVIAITDHDTMAGAFEARELAAEYGVEVIVGEEVSTHEGHMLALFIEHELPKGRPAAETIAAVHAQGGLCFPAHPFAWLVPSMGFAGLRQRCTGPNPVWPVDGLESFNASLWNNRNNLQAASVGKSLGLPLIGGSDSHHLATIGLGYTRFVGRTAADVRTALVAGAVEAGGTSWNRGHSVEWVSLWLRQTLQRALEPTPVQRIEPIGADRADWSG